VVSRGRLYPLFAFFSQQKEQKEQKMRKRSGSMDEQKARKMIRERKGDGNVYG